MPKFSQESFSRLSTCHPDLQTLFYEVVRHRDCTIIEGYRNEHDQNAALQSGASKLAYPNGKHNSQPSLAVDVSPFPLDWTNAKRFYWFAGYVLGIAQRLKDEGKITHSIIWGGDWDGDSDINDQSFNDLVHFQLVT